MQNSSPDIFAPSTHNNNDDNSGSPFANTHHDTTFNQDISQDVISSPSGFSTPTRTSAEFPKLPRSRYYHQQQHTAINTNPSSTAHQKNPLPISSQCHIHLLSSPSSFDEEKNHCGDIMTEQEEEEEMREYSEIDAYPRPIAMGMSRELQDQPSPSASHPYHTIGSNLLTDDPDSALKISYSSKEQQYPHNRNQSQRSDSPLTSKEDELLSIYEHDDPSNSRPWYHPASWSRESKSMVLSCLINARLLSLKHSHASSLCRFCNAILQMVIIICGVLGSGSIVALLAVDHEQRLFASENGSGVSLQNVTEVLVAVFYHTYIIAQAIDKWMRLQDLASQYHKASTRYFHLSNRLEIALAYRIHAPDVEKAIHTFSKIQEKAPSLPLFLRRINSNEKRKMREEFSERRRGRL